MTETGALERQRRWRAARRPRRAGPVACLVVILSTWSLVAAAREPSVLMLDGNGLSAADRRLIEALRIYTSDVGFRVILVDEPPPTIDAAALARIDRLAREEGAALVVWTGRRSNGKLAYFLLTVRDGDIRDTDIAELGLNRAADAVALKIRSLLAAAAAEGSPPSGEAVAPGTGTTTPRPAAATTNAAAASVEKNPGPAAPPPAAAPTSPARPVEVGSSAGPRAGPPPAATVTASSEAGRTAPAPWLGIGAGYDLAAPADGSWVRQGLVLTLEGRLTDSGLVAHLDGALTNQPVIETGGLAGRLRDTPFGFGVLQRWSASRLAMAAGPRVTLHVFDVHAASNADRSGDARRLSGGLGAWAAFEVAVARKGRVWVAASAEALLPAREFTLDGTPFAHTGPALLGAAAGLALALP